MCLTGRHRILWYMFPPDAPKYRLRLNVKVKITERVKDASAMDFSLKIGLFLTLQLVNRRFPCDNPVTGGGDSPKYYYKVENCI